MQVSSREAEVLAALAEHLTNTQIARRLHISVRTVESHVSALLRKAGVPSRRELAGLVPARLPHSDTSFVGRTRDRTVVAGRLAEARLVTLLGPGGVGKTRLALAVATEAVFVDLVPVRAGSVTQALASALGVTERPPRSLADAVISRLAGARTLLVLDNCEHLIDEVGPLAARVLSACAHTSILATSRQRLGLPGEHLVEVAPLGADAPQLFLERARSVTPGFTAAPALVERICARLDGMPLAIELAAARTASLGAEGLLAALDDRLRLLAGGRQADERHRSLAAVIGWSYDLLDAAERDMFRRLSIFAGSFDLGAAQAVSALPGAEAADLIGRLADRSLVVRHGARWRLLDTVREYAASLPTDNSLRLRHLTWAAATAASLASSSAVSSSDVAGLSLDDVADDLRAALAGSAPGPLAHGLARDLGRLTFTRGFFDESRRHFVTAAARAPSDALAVHDLRCAAEAAVIVSDGPAAYELLLSAADRSSGNARAAALAYAVIVSVRYPAGFRSPLDRDALLRDALLAVDHDDPMMTALLAAAQAWHQPSVARSRIAVRAARRTGDVPMLAMTLDGFGAALLQAGQFRASHKVADERLRLVSAMPGDDPICAAEITDAYHVASSAALAAGDLPAARAVVRRTAMHDPIGGHPYLSAPRVVRLLALSGRFDEACSAADALWSSWTRDGEPPLAWMSSALAAAALVHGLRADGEYDLWRSRALALTGHHSPDRSGDLMAIMSFVDARIALHTGVVPSDVLARSSAVYPERWWEGFARAAGAELAVVAGSPDASDRLSALSPLAAQHRWAAASLARARGRLTGSVRLIESSLRQWEHLDARFERACTLLLLPSRASEGADELVALGCPSH